MDKLNPYNLKEGDLVVCVDANDRSGELELGAIYTITNIRRGTALYVDMMFCSTKELPTENLVLDRFVPADLTVLEKVIYGL